MHKHLKRRDSPKGIAIERLGLLVANDIDVSTEGNVPMKRPTSCDFIYITRRTLIPDASLTNVIHGCPNEISKDPTVFPGQIPHMKGLSGERLCADHDTLWM